MKPMGDRILVEPVATPTKMNFFVPEYLMEKDFGIVRGVGKGRTTKKGFVIPIENVKLGDRVMLEPLAHRTDITIDHVLYWLMKPENVLAVMEEELSN